MIDRIEIKEHAREAIREQWFMVFLLDFVVGLIMSVLYIFGLPIYIGAAKNSLDVYNGKKSDFQNISYGFNDNYLKLLGLLLLQGLFVILWSLLLFVPGIIKAYSYSAAIYLFISDPSYNITYYLDESQKVMTGHKMDLFVMDLSFIPLVLLSIITLGIYLIYFVPYYSVAHSGFFSELLDLNKKPTNNVDDDGINYDEIKIKTNDFDDYNKKVDDDDDDIKFKTDGWE